MTGFRIILFTVTAGASFAIGAITMPTVASLPPLEICTQKGC